MEGVDQAAEVAGEQMVNNTVGNINWYNHYGKRVWRDLRKLDLEPSNPTLGHISRQNVP